jgi:hypothetical protein
MPDTKYRRARKVMMKVRNHIVTLQDWAPEAVIENEVKKLRQLGEYRCELFLNGEFAGVYLTYPPPETQVTFVQARVYEEVG